MLQGPLTNLDNVREMMNSVHSTGGGECEVVNYTKGGSPYLAKVQVIPSKYLPFTSIDFSCSFKWFPSANANR